MPMAATAATGARGDLIYPQAGRDALQHQEMSVQTEMMNFHLLTEVDSLAYIIAFFVMDMKLDSVNTRPWGIRLSYVSVFILVSVNTWV